MKLDAGKRVWIPCEVKPGPFSNERMVRVSAGGADWLGFVELQHLKHTITEGQTYVRVLVVEVENDHFRANLPGHAFAGSWFHGAVSR